MNARELQDYLNARIPLSRAMAVEVRAASAGSGVELGAPLAPNINHRDTVFGGSASAVAILAAWSVLFLRLRAEGRSGRIVIRRNTMSYERPIAGDFTAFAAPPDATTWSRSLATLDRGRAARVHATATLRCEGETVGVLEGEFVILPVPQ